MSMRISRTRTLLATRNWKAREATNVSATRGLVSVPPEKLVRLRSARAARAWLDGV